MIRSTIFAAVAIAAAAVSAISAPVFAAEAPVIEVRYNDLSLKSPEGAQLLNARFERAARRVCATEDSRNLKAVAASQECRRVAIAKAMPQVELALANAHSQKVAENSRVSVISH